MAGELFLDAVRFSHLVGVAMGLGLGIYADARFVKGLGRPMLPSRVAELRRIHDHVAVALVVLWTSGLGLLWLRTGFDPAQMSPKLLTKLAIVGILTLNARVIGAIALPILERAVERRFADLPAAQRLALGVAGGVSCASWTAALGLGVFTAAKGLGPAELLTAMGATYAAALLGGIGLALLAPVLAGAGRRRPDAGWVTARRVPLAG